MRGRFYLVDWHVDNVPGHARRHDEVPRALALEDRPDDARDVEYAVVIDRVYLAPVLDRGPGDVERATYACIRDDDVQSAEIVRDGRQALLNRRSILLE